MVRASAKDRLSAYRYWTPLTQANRGSGARAVRNCMRDEGRSFEVGNQVLISSHRKLLLSKAMEAPPFHGARQEPTLACLQLNLIRRCHSTEVFLNHAQIGPQSP
jgi:hypothetical protein